MTLYIRHGGIELFIDRPPQFPGFLLSWPQKRWCCLVPAGAHPAPVWLRSQGLGANQAETIAEVWTLAVVPLLHKLDTLAGVIATALELPQVCPTTRRAQIDVLVRLTRNAEHAHVVEALRILERQDRVLYDVSAEGELLWWVSTPADHVAPSEQRRLRAITGR